MKKSRNIFPAREKSGKSSVFIPVILPAADKYIFIEKYFLSPEISPGASLYSIDTAGMNDSGLSPAAGAGLATGFLYSSSVNLHSGVRYYNVILKNRNLNWASVRIGAEKSFWL